MNKYKIFRDFCQQYQTQIVIENDLEKAGLSIGEGKLSDSINYFISMIPNLIFNEEGVDIFWNDLNYDMNFSDEYIDQLWEELKEYQL